MREKYDTGLLAFDPFLPISVERDLRVCKYTTFCEKHRIDYAEFMRMVSSDGFTLRRGRRYIILYNDAPHISAARKRFTLAHELGHYALRHTQDGVAEEEEANCFARNLLAPRRLALERGIEYADYPRVFDISPSAARMCIKFAALDESSALGFRKSRGKE